MTAYGTPTPTGRRAQSTMPDELLVSVDLEYPVAPHGGDVVAPRGLRALAVPTALVRVCNVRSAGAVDRYPLRGLLFCRCGQRFIPGCSNPSGREYVSLCGCRLWPIDAAAVEQRVHAHATCGVPTTGSSRLPRFTAAVLRQFDLRIEVGGTVGDVRFVLRV